MFKYIRTMNSCQSVPEIVKIQVPINLEFCEGEICSVNEAGQLTYSIASSYVKYLVLENKKENESKAELRCMRILPGMLFEADLSEDGFEYLAIGNTFELSTKNSHNLFVGPLTGNDVEIISTLNYPKGRKVIVTFI